MTFKFSIAQINPTIGDIDGNIELMRSAAARALNEGASVVVFPELSLTGYYPADMLDDPAFQQRIESGLERARKVSTELPDVYWVMGAPTPHHGIGKRFHNSLLVLKAGEIALTYHKQLLPTYNIFDERRHFEPGPDVAKVLRVHYPGGEVHLGFMVCEDGWNDECHDYAINPFARLTEASPDLVISINASPSNVGKREMRHDIFRRASSKYGLPIAYVNQIGGHDQLVFDGGSFLVEPEAGVVFEAPQFETCLRTIGFNQDRHFLDRDGQALRAIFTSAMNRSEFYRRQIVLGLKDYARRCGFKTAVVGSSGGIDSALTLALAVEALGRENIAAMTMPSEYSSEGSVSDSQRLCENLGIKLYTHPIRELVDVYRKAFAQSTGTAMEGLALENLQARIRGTILMEFSNRFGHLLLTTGNKSELSVGYCTLYGDTNGGLGVIGDLYKTEVFALSRYINEAAGREVIPPGIIEKPPSAELAPGQKDTDSLPPYEILDEVLKVLIEGNRLEASEQHIAQAKFDELQQTETGRELIAKVKRMIARNEYKRRQAPPILRVRARAFGSGRQMPIAAHYE
ncbi:MAG TPA: NAD+ synthase [Steroidobacteraceae bacterium]|nr:NAD+ synthase [Steroidobacteraceae bacterium]